MHAASSASCSARTISTRRKIRFRSVPISLNSSRRILPPQRRRDPEDAGKGQPSARLMVQELEKSRSSPRKRLRRSSSKISLKTRAMTPPCRCAALSRRRKKEAGHRGEKDHQPRYPALRGRSGIRAHRLRRAAAKRRHEGTHHRARGQEHPRSRERNGCGTHHRRYARGRHRFRGSTPCAGRLHAFRWKSSSETGASIPRVSKRRSKRSAKSWTFR